MLAFFKITLYEPLYNALVFLSSIVPGNDLGVAIILLTVLVKIVLYPLYHKTLITQHKMREINPTLKEIKNNKQLSKEEQTKKILALYKEHGLNPFTGFFVLLIQLPIVITLFYVFKDSLSLHPDLLYSFTKVPETLNIVFLNIFDITQRSYIFAILAGLTQFFQIKLSIPPLPKPEKDKPRSFEEDFQRSMNLQMRYFMPIVIVFVSFTLPAAIALYWTSNNILGIFHELWVKKKALKIVENTN